MKAVLKKLRQEHGLTQAGLAEKINVTQSAVSLWEKGKANPDFETQQKLADFYNISIDELLGRKALSQSNVITVTADNNGINQVNAPVTIHDNNLKLSTQERDLLRIFRGATGKQQMKLMNLAYEIEDERGD